MKNNPANKLPGVKTGKDILNLFRSKEKKAGDKNGHAPAGDIEIGLFAIWTSVLGHDNFGTADDFFQVGGSFTSEFS
jgi:hypothetical protein